MNNSTYVAYVRPSIRGTKPFILGLPQRAPNTKPNDEDVYASIRESIPAGPDLDGVFLLMETENVPSTEDLLNLLNDLHGSGDLADHLLPLAQAWEPQT